VVTIKHKKESEVPDSEYVIRLMAGCTVLTLLAKEAKVAETMLPVVNVMAQD